MATKKTTSKPAERLREAPAFVDREEKKTPPEEQPAVNQRLQKDADAVSKQGFYGVEVDVTPNTAYTVAGVTSGEATPETSLEAADAARDHQRTIRGRGNGPGQE